MCIQVRFKVWYLAYKAFNNFRSKYLRRHFLPKISEHWNCFLSLSFCFTPCRYPTDWLFHLFLIPSPWKKTYWQLKGMSKVFCLQYFSIWELMIVRAHDSVDLFNYDLLYCLTLCITFNWVFYILYCIVIDCISMLLGEILTYCQKWQIGIE